jgi:hypothetical protein
MFKTLLPRRQSIKIKLYKLIVFFLLKKQQINFNLISKTFYLFLQNPPRLLLKNIFFLPKLFSFGFKNWLKISAARLKSKRRKKKNLKKIKLKNFFLYTNKKKYSPLTHSAQITKMSVNLIASTYEDEFFNYTKRFELKNYLIAQLIFSSAVFRKPFDRCYRILTNLFYKFFFLLGTSRRKRYKLLLLLKKMIRSNRLLPPAKKKIPTFKLFVSAFFISHVSAVFKKTPQLNLNVKYSIVYNNLYYNIFFFKH